MISLMITMAALLLAATFYQRMKRRRAEDLMLPDEGQAILDFGRAFPDEAIRAIHPTADGLAFFVRLHDGKAGFMLSQGLHFICHLIVPGKVQMNHAPSGQGLTLTFTDFPYLNGTYEFASAETAAEVALWILGSFSQQPIGTAPLAAD